MTFPIFGCARYSTNYRRSFGCPSFCSRYSAFIVGCSIVWKRGQYLAARPGVFPVRDPGIVAINRGTVLQVPPGERLGNRLGRSCNADRPQHQSHRRNQSIQPMRIEFLSQACGSDLSGCFQVQNPHNCRRNLRRHGLWRKNIHVANCRQHRCTYPSFVIQCLRKLDWKFIPSE